MNPAAGWTYTDPDTGDVLAVYDTVDGQQALHCPRYDGDPEPYCDEGITGRRYRPDQVGTAFADAAERVVTTAFAQFTDDRGETMASNTSSNPNTGLNADGSTDQMSDALKGAGDELESIAAENSRIAGAFERNGWVGMDKLAQTHIKIGNVRDRLSTVAGKIGIGGAAVRDARLNNTMATNATSESLGRS